METAVLDGVVAALPFAEAAALRAQIKAAYVDRAWGHKSAHFSFPAQAKVPVLDRLAKVPRQPMAVVKVVGLSSRFTTTATLIVSDGLLAELHFDPILWSGSENYLVECKLIGLKPKVVPLTEEAEESRPGASGAS